MLRSTKEERKQKKKLHYKHLDKLRGVCLQILNFFNISGMDEVALFKLGKCVEYGRVHPRGEQFSHERGVV